MMVQKVFGTPGFLLLLFVIGYSAQTTGKSKDCNQKFLLAVTEENDDVEISIFYENVPDNVYTLTSQNHIQQPVKGHRLSSECGDKFSRCDDPVVVTTAINKTFTQHLLFVPLSDGLLLAEIIYNGVYMSFGQQYVLDTLQPAQYHCSPVSIHSISNSHFVVCVDSERRYISLSEIYLNKISIKHTTLSSPVIEFNFRDGVDMQTLSNFVAVEDGPLFQMIYFALGSSMYAFNIANFVGHNDLGNIGNNCTHVQQLEFIGGQRLIAYCAHVYVYYSLVYEDWEFQWWNNMDGVAYTCPDKNIHLLVFKQSMYIKFTINSLVGNIDIPGENFVDGVCFGAANKTTMFAYSDMSNGVYVVNLDTSEVMQLSSSSCATTGCLPLEVFENQYLVIRENKQNDGNAFVYDSEKNFSKIIEAQHILPSLVMLINDSTLQCMQKNESEILTFDESANAGAIAGSLAGVVTVLALAVVIAIVLAAVFYYRPKPEPDTYPRHPTQEKGETDIESQSEKVLVRYEGGYNLSAKPSVHPDLPPTTMPIQVDNNSTPVRAISKSHPVTTPTNETKEGKCQNTKRVGNTDDIGHNCTILNTVESATASPKDHETIEMQHTLDRQSNEMNTHGASASPLHLEDMEDVPKSKHSNTESNTLVQVNFATPKLDVADVGEKWQTEDDHSESSYSSREDDKKPLLPTND